MQPGGELNRGVGEPETARAGAVRVEKNSDGRSNRHTAHSEKLTDVNDSHAGFDLPGSGTGRIVQPLGRPNTGGSPSRREG